MNSRHQSAWVALFIAVLLLAAPAKQCSASITLHMTGGYADIVSPMTFTTTIFGNASTGEQFVIRLHGIYDGTVNPVAHSVITPGAPVNPRVFASGFDYRASSFTLDGNAVPLNHSTPREGHSLISISGPSSLTAIPIAPHTHFILIVFEFSSTLFVVGGSTDPDDPDYKLTAQGTGLAELELIPVADNTVYHVERAHFALVVAPELGAFAVWSILAFAAISYRRRLA